MAHVNFLPYSRNSGSVRILKNRLANSVILSSNSPRIQRLHDLTRPFSNDVVFIRWGNSKQDFVFNDVPARKGNTLFLNWDVGPKYTNKKTFFNSFPTVKNFGYFPKVWERWEDAQDEWDRLSREYGNEPNKILMVERHDLNGSGGAGIRFVTPATAPHPNGKLWTRYIPKAAEYRLHISKSRGIFAAQKKFLIRDNLAGEGNERQMQFALRNYDSGWRYQIVDVDSIPGSTELAALRLIADDNFKLDFCAIDVIYNHRQGCSYILEANTAPGVSDPLTDRYIEHINALVNAHQFSADSTGGIR